jgi:hypothetical protein
MRKATIPMLIFLFVTTPLLFSQQTENIFTDRPDKTELPEILYKNYLQLETGISYEKDNSKTDLKKENFYLPEILLRYGMSDFIEWRFELNYSKNNLLSLNGNEHQSGFESPNLGIKVKLLSEYKMIPATSLLLDLDLPGISGSYYKIRHISPELRILMDNNITKNIDLGYNLGLSWNNDEKTTTGYYSVSLGYSPLKYLYIFFESYGYLDNSSTADTRLDYGLTLSVIKNLQFNFSSGIGLSKISPDYYFDCGISLIIPM